ncbi:MAG: septum formation initiator family protein [Alphaproteobacteria bacterium]|nr:septum formation initiator family protein [Alphaproteobacteria bacterium]
MIMNKNTKYIVNVVLSVLGVFIVLYFLYTAIQGERGFFELKRLKAEVAEAEENLARLREEKQGLEHKIDLMKGENADEDLLEEEARRLLNFSKPNEVIILTPDADNEELGN